ncbi:nitrate regulatory protein [Comamonas serinivorans]|uniref:nitrate regulatory protein n=1 Tax=Comamonas serinivorans TaxID=1082851 RepID=UPI00146C84B8|nr:nitrate- and nitrite sensing domain-containing protein [Comamonas serinivorans]
MPVSRAPAQAPVHDSALTLRFMLAAHRRELQGMGELAQTCELVITVGRLVHALQKERGQAMLHLTLVAVRPADVRSTWAAQVDVAEAAEQALRQQLDDGLAAEAWPLTKPRCLHAVAHALHGLDGLPALRAQLRQARLTADQALDGYGRCIGSLLGVSIEALEGAADPVITHLLVALLNFMQAKELCGQERAHGVRGFAAGAFDDAHRRLMAGLVQAQERSIELFCQHAPAALLARWQALRADELALQRLRALSQGTQPQAPAFAPIWFDVCTARIDAMHELERELALHLAACCRERVTETTQALASLNQASRQYHELSIDRKTAVAYTLVGRPLDAAVNGDAMGDAMARSVLDVLLEQGVRLHEADQALAQARRAQVERRRIEQAKWRLVSQHGLSEAAAHEQLLRMAMNAGMTLLDVAERVLRDPGEA